MNAALQERYGPPQVVEVREIDRPLPSQDPLDDVVAALRWVEDGHARGKVIVIP